MYGILFLHWFINNESITHIQCLKMLPPALTFLTFPDLFLPACESDGLNHSTYCLKIHNSRDLADNTIKIRMTKQHTWSQWQNWKVSLQNPCQILSAIHPQSTTPPDNSKVTRSTSRVCRHYRRLEQQRLNMYTIYNYIIIYYCIFTTFTCWQEEKNLQVPIATMDHRPAPSSMHPWVMFAVGHQ